MYICKQKEPPRELPLYTVPLDLSTTWQIERNLKLIDTKLKPDTLESLQTCNTHRNIICGEERLRNIYLD